MAAEVGRVYNSLPPDIRPKTAILASTFSQAGAIDLFGPKFGLPNSIGLNQSYFCGDRAITLAKASWFWD